MADPEIRIKVNANADDAKRSFGDLAREIPGVGRALELIKNPVVLLIALFTGLAAAVKGAVAEFAGAQVQSARLDAALARSGQLTDEYRESLHDLASQMQETTGVADDQWFEVIRKLTQFGANEGNIGALTDGVKNLAGIMDGDLQGAANLVARALQGNFEVMSRYGIQAKNVTDLLKELSEKGQGQLEARSKTLTGAWENLTNQLNDLREGIGGLINRTGLLKASIDFVAGAFQFWVEKIGNVQDQIPGLNNAVDGSAKAMEAAAGATKRNADQLDRMDKSLAAINEKYAEQKRQLDLQKSGEERDLALDRDIALAELELSDASPAEKVLRRAQIEKDFAGRETALQQKFRAAGVQNQLGLAYETSGEIANLTEQAAQLEASIATSEKQAGTNKEIAELRARREELAKTLRSVSGYGPAVDETLGVPGMRDEFGRISRRLSQISYVATTLDQDRAQLGVVRGRIGDLQPQLAEQATVFNTTAADEIFERGMDARLGPKRDLVGMLGAQAQVGGMVSQAKSAASQEILSGQAGKAVEDLRELESIMSRLFTEVSEVKKRVRDVERNNRDQ